MILTLSRHFRARNPDINTDEDIVKAVAKFCHVQGKYNLSSYCGSKYHSTLGISRWLLMLKVIAPKSSFKSNDFRG